MSKGKADCTVKVSTMTDKVEMEPQEQINLNMKKLIWASVYEIIKLIEWNGWNNEEQWIVHQ